LPISRTEQVRFVYGVAKRKFLEGDFDGGKGVPAGALPIRPKVLALRCSEEV